MKHVAYVLFALSLVPSLGCGDDAPADPGAIDVKWTLGPVATCSSTQLSKIEARAYRGTTLENTATMDCAIASSKGTLTIDELAPAKYKVIVEGLNAADKATWRIESSTLTVSSGKTVESPELRLEPKPASVAVDWTLPSGGRCLKDGISKIAISLFTSDGIELAGQKQTVSCEDAEYVDPDDPSSKLPGALFIDLEPTEPGKGLIILAYGLDDKGGQIARGQVAGIEVGRGDRAEVDIKLDACPAEGCE